MNKQQEQFIENAIQILQKDGGRITTARKMILHILAKSEKPLQAKDIMQIISKQKSETKIDLASIYRSLDSFLELGLIHQVGPSSAYMACLHINCHAHLHCMIQCTKCSKTFEYEGDESLIADLLVKLKKQHNFKVDTHSIQIKGLCANCNKT